MVTGVQTCALPISAPEPAASATLRLRFHGSMVLLFGESTLATGCYRAAIDGVVVRDQQAKPPSETFDPGAFARTCNGNVHLVRVLATGLDAAREHTLDLEPASGAGKQDGELRLESVCVAGPGAQAALVPASR